jgi:hypothetical protein
VIRGRSPQTVMLSQTNYMNPLNTKICDQRVDTGRYKIPQGNVSGATMGPHTDHLGLDVHFITNDAWSQLVGIARMVDCYFAVVVFLAWNPRSFGLFRYLARPQLVCAIIGVSMHLIPTC